MSIPSNPGHIVYKVTQLSAAYLIFYSLAQYEAWHWSNKSAYHLLLLQVEFSLLPRPK